MNSLQIFNSKEFGEIRVVEQNGEPWFVAKDVCEILEIKNATDVIKRLDADEVTRFNLGGLAGEVNIVNEYGLYSLVLGSRKAEAKQFKRWITHEVIPTIRKHGGYMTPQKIEEVLSNPDTIIRLATESKQEREVRQQAQALIESQKPKVVFAEAVTASDKSILINELAKILCQNGLNIGQNRLYRRLVETGYLFYRDGGYLPTQRAAELKVFELKKTAINVPDREPIVKNTIKVTPKGQIYFVNKFVPRQEEAV